MRRRSPFFVLAWLVLAGLATSASAAVAPVRLVSPAPGAVLRAGSTAEIAWEPLARLEPGVEEWEAFLSLDGGETYPLRVTPHLDRDLRRVRWQVPPVPTAEARILLRFGDERQETYVELPQRFSIEPSPALTRAFELAAVAAGPGEPARPGAAGVVAWVEGSRRGGGWRQVVAAQRPCFRPQVSLPASHHEEAVLDAGETEVHPPQPLSESHGQAAPPTLRGSPFRQARTAPLPAADILLLTQRQNE